MADPIGKVRVTVTFDVPVYSLEDYNADNVAECAQEIEQGYNLGTWEVEDLLDWGESVKVSAEEKV